MNVQNLRNTYHSLLALHCADLIIVRSQPTYNYTIRDRICWRHGEAVENLYRYRQP